MTICFIFKIANPKLIIEDRVFDFTIYGNTLFYMTAENKIYQTDLDGNNPKFITDGLYPLALSKYLFYYTLDKQLMWISY